MKEDVYERLRDVLDMIPNGYPRAEKGADIRMLKKIYTEEEADIASRLLLKLETPEAIAARTGLDRDRLEKMLPEMRDKGQIFGATIGGLGIYKLLPFVFGVYEFQINRMDDEFVDLAEEYSPVFFSDFFKHTPPLMKVVPIEREIPAGSVIQPYERVSALVGNAKAWAIGECICKKEKRMQGKGCENPLEVCMALAPIEGYFDNFFWGRPITMEEAFGVLERAEESGLVHMTSNVRTGHIYVCNCCGCCCGILRGITELGLEGSVARSNYRAAVDGPQCNGCGICAERCQVGSIEIDGTARVLDKCIGCGLCVSACPAGAMSMMLRDDGDIDPVPADEKEWMRLRAESRKDTRYRDLFKS